MKHIISVCGYGSTGSSAVLDLLKEVINIKVSDIEMRFIQDANGLEELCFLMTHGWGSVRSDNCIRRFIEYTDILARKQGLWNFGQAIESSFNNKFLLHRDSFIRSIVDSSWRGHNIYHDFYGRGPVEHLVERLKRSTGRIGATPEFIRRITHKSETFFARRDTDFYAEGRKFLRNLFTEAFADESSTHIILDQGVLPYGLESFSKLFDHLTVIVVDRDPRDVYLDSLSYNAFPITEDIGTFISFYESSRAFHKSEDQDVNGSILRISFEDLVFEYQRLVEHIFTFCDIDSSRHVNKRAFFDPEISIKNIRMWQRPEFESHLGSIYEIEKRIPQFCRET